MQYNQYSFELSKFHENQQKAITHLDGPALVLAGPGSGKTLVITHRIKHLIETHHIHPTQILVITFTKAAATEMKTRFEKLMQKPYPVMFGTFHSVFFHILKQFYHYTFENIIREHEKYAYMREILAQPTFAQHLDEQMIASLLLEISIVKNSGIEVSQYKTELIDNAVFIKLFQAYEQCLQWHKKIDFDDMILQCYKLLTSRKEILKEWQKVFSYILIDEFQDSSKQQYELIRMLAYPLNNLFVVGDDDQAIYGFRGAKPAIMQTFVEDYTDAKTIVMHQNYRSNKEIVAYSGKLIAHNKERFPKQISAAKMSATAENTKFSNVILTEENETEQKKQKNVIIKGFESKEAEYDFLVKQIHELWMQKKLYDVAVIYRTNKEATYLAERLAKCNIPFIVKERTTSIYQSKSAKDIFAYMQFAKMQTRSLFYQIMNKPLRYLSRNSIAEETVNWQSLLTYYHGKPHMQEQVIQLKQQINQLAVLSPYAAIMYIRRGIGYDTYLLEQSGKTGEERQKILEEVEMLSERAKAYDTLEQWQEDIRIYEESLKNQNRTTLSNKDMVSIITMHGAKGLEYETVYIPDMNEGTIPHKKSVTTEALEEERRMLYVAMTRAKENLSLFYVEGKDERKGKSRFIGEILE